MIPLRFIFHTSQSDRLLGVRAWRSSVETFWPAFQIVRVRTWAYGTNRWSNCFKIISCWQTDNQRFGDRHLKSGWGNIAVAAHLRVAALLCRFWILYRAKEDGAVFLVRQPAPWWYSFEALSQFCAKQALISLFRGLLTALVVSGCMESVSKGASMMYGSIAPLFTTLSCRDYDILGITVMDTGMGMVRVTTTSIHTRTRYDPRERSIQKMSRVMFCRTVSQVRFARGDSWSDF